MKIIRCTLKCSIAALVVLLVLSTTLRAQVVAGSSDVAGNVGYSNLTGLDGNKHINFGGSYSYNSAARSTIVVEYSYLPMGSLKASGSGVSISTSGNYQLFGVAERLNIGNSKHVVPYVLIGLGYDRCSASASVSATGLGSASAGAAIGGYYVGFGGGASIYLGNDWGIRPEVRADVQEFSDSGTYVEQNAVRESVSFFYQWGGKQATKK
jgi:hypothetical protein